MSIDSQGHKHGRDGRFVEQRRDDTLGADALGAEPSTAAATATATSADADYWGEVTEADTGRVGAVHPRGWGMVHEVRPLGPGLSYVDTDISGLYVLSGERNQAIPEPLRREDATYENGLDGYIPAAYHPDALAAQTHRTEAPTEHQIEETRRYGMEGVRNWHWRAYEAASGAPIALGVSHEKDRADWFSENESTFIGQEATYSEDGESVSVRLRRPADGHQIRMTVSAAEFDRDRELHGAFMPPFNVREPHLSSV